MTKTVHLLAIGTSESLSDDFELALRSVRSCSVVFRFERDYRRGIEEARSRQPDMVAVEMQADPRRLRAVADELSAVAPGAVLIGVFGEDSFADEQAEGAYLIQALRSQVRDFLRRPVSTAELSEVLDRYLLAHADRGARGAGDGRIVSFVSNKGGVGKSTLAVNTAVTLARRYPGEVLLLDSSLQLGTAATLLDAQPTTDLTSVAREIDRLDPALLRDSAVDVGSGLRLLAAPTDAFVGNDVDDEVVSRVLGIARRTFRFVVVDTFPVLDAVTLAVLDRADCNYIVVGGDVPTVVGVEQLLGLLDRVGVQRSKQRVVLNSPQPKHAAALRPVDVAERLQRTLDFVVPFEKSVLVGTNTGQPVAANGRSMFGFGRAIRGIADDVDGGVKPAAARKVPPPSRDDSPAEAQP